MPVEIRYQSHIIPVFWSESTDEDEDRLDVEFFLLLDFSSTCAIGG